MWFVMEKAQHVHGAYEQLMSVISDQLLDDDERDSVVDALLSQKIDPNRMHGHFLPLHCAVLYGRMNIIKTLLKYKADPNLHDGYSSSALTYAIDQPIECLKTMLESGVDLTHTPPGNPGPLHWAAYKNRLQHLRLLLDYGADVNLPDSRGDTPVSWASIGGNYLAIRLLLDYNCQCDSVRTNGWLPMPIYRNLTCAVRNNHLISDAEKENAVERADKCLQVLLEAVGHFEARRLDADATDNPYRYPLHSRMHSNALANLITRSQQPLGLKHLCRYVIRRQMGPGWMDKRSNVLPMPETEKRFLLIQTLS